MQTIGPTSQRVIHPQTRPGQGQPIDFQDGFSNASEALLLPMVDPLASCAVASLFGNRAQVTVESCGQRLTYAPVLGDQLKFPMQAEINGKPFELQVAMDADTRTATVSGDTPAGRVDTLMDASQENVDGNVTVHGQAGSVPFSLQTRLLLDNVGPDQLPAFHVEGLVAGQAYHFDFATNGQGQGALGSLPIRASLTRGPRGEANIDQWLGSTEIRETIRPASDPPNQP